MVVDLSNDLEVLALAVEARIGDLAVATADFAFTSLYLQALASISVKILIFSALDAQSARKRSVQSGEQDRRLQHSSFEFELTVKELSLNSKNDRYILTESKIQL